MYEWWISGSGNQNESRGFAKCRKWQRTITAARKCNRGKDESSVVLSYARAADSAPTQPRKRSVITCRLRNRDAWQRFVSTCWFGGLWMWNVEVTANLPSQMVSNPVCRGTELRLFFAGFSHHECRPPSRTKMQPCSPMCASSSRRFTRQAAPRQNRLEQHGEHLLG